MKRSVRPLEGDTSGDPGSSTIESSSLPSAVGASAESAHPLPTILPHRHIISSSLLVAILSFDEPMIHKAQHAVSSVPTTTFETRRVRHHQKPRVFVVFIYFYLWDVSRSLSLHSTGTPRLSQTLFGGRFFKLSTRPCRTILPSIGYALRASPCHPSEIAMRGEVMDGVLHLKGSYLV